MPESYSITINNASNSAKSFLLFQAIPKPSNIPGEEVFLNVYQRSIKVQGDGNSSVTFSMTNEWFALYGTEMKTKDGKVRVSTSSYKAVKLGPKGTYQLLTTDSGTSPMWDNSGKETAAAGAFTIATDGSFTYPNPSKIYFGAGARDPNSGAVVPVQTYIAKPNTLSQLYPKVRYYIAWGEYEPGSIIDRDELGSVLLVDFTTASLRDATFTLNSHSEYDADPLVENSGIKFSFGLPDTD